MVIQSSQNYYVPGSSSVNAAPIFSVSPVNQSVAPGFVSTFSGVVRGSGGAANNYSGGVSHTTKPKPIYSINASPVSNNDVITEEKKLVFATDTSEETIKRVISAGSDNPQTFTPGTYLGYEDTARKQSVYNPQKVVRYNAPVQAEEQVYPRGITTYADKRGNTEVTVIPPVRRVKTDIKSEAKQVLSNAGVPLGVETTTQVGVSDYSLKTNFKGGLDIMRNENTINKIISTNPQERIAYLAKGSRANVESSGAGSKARFAVRNLFFQKDTPIITVVGKVVDTAITGIRTLQGGNKESATEFKGNIKDLTSGSYYKNAWETSEKKNYEDYVRYQESNTIGLGIDNFYGVPIPKVTGKVGMFFETPTFEILATRAGGYAAGSVFGGLATKAASGSALASKAITGAKIASAGAIGVAAYGSVIAPYRAGKHQEASENIFKIGAAYALATPAFKAGYNAQLNAYSNRLVRERLNIRQASQGASEETGAYNEATGKGVSARISKYSFNIEGGKLGNLKGTYEGMDKGNFEFKNNVVIGESTTKGNIRASGSMLGKGDKLLTGDVYGKNFYELTSSGSYSYSEDLGNRLYSIPDNQLTNVELGSVRFGGKSVTAYKVNGGVSKFITTNAAGTGGVSYEQLVSSPTGETGIFKSSYNIRSENIMNNRLVGRGAFDLTSSGTKKIDYAGDLQNYNIKELTSGTGTARLSNTKSFTNPSVNDIKGFIYGKTYTIGGESGGLSYERGGVFLSGGSPLSTGGTGAVSSFAPGSALSSAQGAFMNTQAVSSISGVVSSSISGAISGSVGDLSVISASIPGIKSAFSSRASSSGLTKYESASISAPKSEIAAVSAYLTEPVSTSIIRADTSYLSNTKSVYSTQAIAQAQEITARQTSIQDTQAAKTSGFSTGITTPPVITSVYNPLPPGASILGVRGGYSRRARYKSGKKQYAPSLYAGLTGITSTQKGKSVNITGIGIRPVIIKENKNKKKRGSKLW
jgi:hypothetical protein